MASIRQRNQDGNWSTWKSVSTFLKIDMNFYLRRDEYFLHGEITRQLTHRKELAEAELAHSIACSFNAASNIVETGGKDYKQLNTILQG